MIRLRRLGGLALFVCAQTASPAGTPAVSIEDVEQDIPRSMRIDDLSAVRGVERLEVSPDGKRYAVLVRQGDAGENRWQSAWFVGAIRGGTLAYVADGGSLRPEVAGAGISSDARWSPDGQWIAYTRATLGEVQVWRSRPDGSDQRQVTHNSADVEEFAWSDDGRSIYFIVGAARAELRAYDDRQERSGYRYDDDIAGVGDLYSPIPVRYTGPAVDTRKSTFVVTLQDGAERPATSEECEQFRTAHARHEAGRDSVEISWANLQVPPVQRLDGASISLRRSKPHSRYSRLIANIKSTSAPIRCGAPECLGFVRNVWWRENGKSVLFMRDDGIGVGEYGGSGGRGLYEWSIKDDRISTVLYTFDYLQHCAMAAGDHVICVRETATAPPHIVSIDTRSSGAMRTIADLNPEFVNIRFGRVERFEWETPRFSWSEPGGELHGVFPSHAYGYILYPPDFDPAKKYPVIIDPYVARGFNSSAGGEHALQVYAANGFVVVNMAFPQARENLLALLGKDYLEMEFSERLNFPLFSLYAESTVRGLRALQVRRFVDENRVGIGGVSTGSFVPLYITQKYRLIAAMSISSAVWNSSACYLPSMRGRETAGALITEPGCEQRKVWTQLDPADHVEEIEAPILFQLSAAEAPSVARLLRNLADARRPYDAYVFRNELHFKWQPAHLRAIQERNLDWFRFWLQGYEDPNPSKSEQYLRWRALWPIAVHESGRTQTLE
jgi:dipeptidyl aminopeptidase/acylaminoacyl peptidase